MKSLSISTATAALAISLASTAHASEGVPHVAPEMDTLLFGEADMVLADAVVSADAEVVFEPADEEEADRIIASVESDDEGEPAMFADNFLNNALALDAPAGLSLPVAGPIAGPVDMSARVVTAQSINPSYGDIDAFWGDIVAFYGDIDAFWGDIAPFYGDIGAFYGDIGAFWGDISPFYGDIGAFWGDIDAFWGDIVAFNGGNLQALGNFWQSSTKQINTVESHWSSLKYSLSFTGDVIITFDGTPDRIRNSMETLIAQAEAQFGATYTAKTGKSFRDGFVAEILARHGIDLANDKIAKKTLAKTDAERAAFFLDWHDSLNAYSGIDAVDHWMGAVNWTPAITHIQGKGKQTIIGIVDGSFGTDADLGNNVVWQGGGTTSVGGHGAGVASLIAGAHDGNGVMGIAPDVKIATYNPFDANHKASWDSVATGIESLLLDAYIGGNETGYVSIINLSLGESGWAFSQGLADVFARPNIANWNHETIYVVAAGNDGISQTANINWDYNSDTTFILVGSIDPNGQISSFSNRPGSACLLNNGVCGAGNELFMRTVVAPGSLLLVSDGQGGVTRASGTSFAAPLVSGAVSLLHDRWKWLARYPEETADIIFRSARDLGAPGPDEVYGWGLLDVAASQSPLDFGQLSFKMYEKNGANYTNYHVTASNLLGQGTIPGWWETDGAYLTAFEKIGGTFRDFAIPLSSLQRGNSTNALGHGTQRMQDFVADRFANWLLSGGADKDGDGKAGINQIRSNSGETSGEWTVQYDGLAPRFTQDGAVRPVHDAVKLTNPRGNMSFTVGHGQGALALNGGNFGIASDHNPATGGVNPILGFASGEFFAGASYMPTRTTEVTVGYSADRQDWEDLDFVTELDRQMQRQLGAREAQALTVAVDQKITDRLSVNAQWTRLNEADAVLGAQTGNDALLGEGSMTDAVTVSANIDFGNGLSFDLSATGGATETDDGQLLASNGRALSTAGQFSINKRGVMNSRDVLRVSVGQPLNVERGQLELRSDQVVDRETGEIGTVSQFIDIDTKRRYSGEFVYATPVSEQSEFGLVARYVSEGGPGEEESVMIGANFGWRF